MTNQEKFQGFKQKMIDDNEKKYGKEIRGKYGDDSVDEFNKKIADMTKDQLAEAERLSAELAEVLAAACQTGDPAGALAQRAADIHRRWLGCYMDAYSKELHAGLAQMYVDDERFTAYYEKIRPGSAKFLRDAILIYTGNAPSV